MIEAFARALARLPLRWVHAAGTALLHINVSQCANKGAARTGVIALDLAPTRACGEGIAERLTGRPWLHGGRVGDGPGGVRIAAAQEEGNAVRAHRAGCPAVGQRVGRIEPRRRGGK